MLISSPRASLLLHKRAILTYHLADLVEGLDVVLAVLGEVGYVIDLPPAGIVFDADLGLAGIACQMAGQAEWGGESAAPRG